MEDEPLYIRKTRAEFTSKGNIPGGGQYVAGSQDSVPDCLALGFCGGIHFGIRVTKNVKNGSIYNVENYYYYTAAGYLDSLKSPLDKYKEKWIKEWFTGSITDWAGRATSFYQLLTPYFSYGPIWVAESAKPNSDKITVNPRLASYDFARIVPPYQAWRDLTVYLSNIANPNPIIPTISNSDMIVSKGFNHPDRFRAIKGESGPKRKRRK